MKGNFLVLLSFFLQIFSTFNLDSNGQDIGGWSALHEAAFAGREDFIKLLLSRGASINIQNSDGATPLFTAVQYGKHSCLKLLLKEGADVNILTVDGASPLFIAAQEGLVDCMNTLLAAGDCFKLRLLIVIPVISNSPFQIYSLQSKVNKSVRIYNALSSHEIAK